MFLTSYDVFQSINSFPLKENGYAYTVLANIAARLSFPFYVSSETAINCEYCCYILYHIGQSLFFVTQLEQLNDEMIKIAVATTIAAYNPCYQKIKHLVPEAISSYPNVNDS